MSITLDIFQLSSSGLIRGRQPKRITMPEGNCSLCGTFCELSFDHVPPRASFNKQTKYQEVPFADFIKSENPLEQKFKGKIEQGGIGFYSLCKTCNSFLGANYVNSYIKYSNSFIEFAKKERFNHFEFEMHQFKAARVLKQTVAMFISLNQWHHMQHYPELRTYVLDVNNHQLPSNFRFFIYLKTEGELRNLPVTVVGNLSTGKSIMGSEIAFPPLGHVMTIGFSGQLPGHCEITHFKDFGINDMPSVIFKVNRFPTYLPILLDYRNRVTLNKNMVEGDKE